MFFPKKTANEVLESDEDFIAVLNRNLKSENVNLTRYYGTRDRRTEEEVLEYLRDQTDETVTRALEILRNRVDEFGVAEPIIQKQGDYVVISEPYENSPAHAVGLKAGDEIHAVNSESAKGKTKAVPTLV